MRKRRPKKHSTVAALKKIVALGDKYIVPTTEPWLEILVEADPPRISNATMAGPWYSPQIVSARVAAKYWYQNRTAVAESLDAARDEVIMLRSILIRAGHGRSEERRVGKECRL